MWGSHGRFVDGATVMAWRLWHGDDGIPVSASEECLFASTGIFGTAPAPHAQPTLARLADAGGGAGTTTVVAAAADALPPPAQSLLRYPRDATLRGALCALWSVDAATYADPHLLALLSEHVFLTRYLALLYPPAVFAAARQAPPDDRAALCDAHSSAGAEAAAEEDHLRAAAHYTASLFLDVDPVDCLMALLAVAVALQNLGAHAAAARVLLARHSAAVRLGARGADGVKVKREVRKVCDNAAQSSEYQLAVNCKVWAATEGFDAPADVAAAAAGPVLVRPTPAADAAARTAADEAVAACAARAAAAAASASASAVATAKPKQRARRVFCEDSDEDDEAGAAEEPPAHAPSVTPAAAVPVAFPPMPLAASPHALSLLLPAPAAAWPWEAIAPASLAKHDLPIETLAAVRSGAQCAPGRAPLLHRSSAAAAATAVGAATSSAAAAAATTAAVAADTVRVPAPRPLTVVAAVPAAAVGAHSLPSLLTANWSAAGASAAAAASAPDGGVSQLWWGCGSAAEARRLLDGALQLRAQTTSLLPALVPAAEGARPAGVGDRNGYGGDSSERSTLRYFPCLAPVFTLLRAPPARVDLCDDSHGAGLGEQGQQVDESEQPEQQFLGWLDGALCRVDAAAGAPVLRPPAAAVAPGAFAGSLDGAAAGLCAGAPAPVPVGASCPLAAAVRGFTLQQWLLTAAAASSRRAAWSAAEGYDRWNGPFALPPPHCFNSGEVYCESLALAAASLGTLLEGLGFALIDPLPPLPCRTPAQAQAIRALTQALSAKVSASSGSGSGSGTGAGASAIAGELAPDAVVAAITAAAACVGACTAGVEAEAKAADSSSSVCTGIAGAETDTASGSTEGESASISSVGVSLRAALHAYLDAAAARAGLAAPIKSGLAATGDAPVPGVAVAGANGRRPALALLRLRFPDEIAWHGGGVGVVGSDVEAAAAVAPLNWPLRTGDSPYADTLLTLLPFAAVPARVQLPPLLALALGRYRVPHTLPQTSTAAPAASNAALVAGACVSAAFPPAVEPACAAFARLTVLNHAWCSLSSLLVRGGKIVAESDLERARETRALVCDPAASATVTLALEGLDGPGADRRRRGGRSDAVALLGSLLTTALAAAAPEPGPRCLPSQGRWRDVAAYTLAPSLVRWLAVPAAGCVLITNTRHTCEGLKPPTAASQLPPLLQMSPTELARLSVVLSAAAGCLDSPAVAATAPVPLLSTARRFVATLRAAAAERAAQLCAAAASATKSGDTAVAAAAAETAAAAADAWLSLGQLYSPLPPAGPGLPVPAPAPAPAPAVGAAPMSRLRQRLEEADSAAVSPKDSGGGGSGSASDSDSGTEDDDAAAAAAVQQPVFSGYLAVYSLPADAAASADGTALARGNVVAAYCAARAAAVLLPLPLRSLAAAAVTVDTQSTVNSDSYEDVKSIFVSPAVAAVVLALLPVLAANGVPVHALAPSLRAAVTAAATATAVSPGANTGCPRPPAPHARSWARASSRAVALVLATPPGRFPPCFPPLTPRKAAPTGSDALGDAGGAEVDGEAAATAAELCARGLRWLRALAAFAADALRAAAAAAADAGNAVKARAPGAGVDVDADAVASTITAAWRSVPATAAALLAAAVKATSTGSAAAAAAAAAEGQSDERKDHGQRQHGGRRPRRVTTSEESDASGSDGGSNGDRTQSSDRSARGRNGRRGGSRCVSDDDDGGGGEDTDGDGSAGDGDDDGGDYGPGPRLVTSGGRHLPSLHRHGHGSGPGLRTGTNISSSGGGGGGGGGSGGGGGAGRGRSSDGIGTGSAASGVSIGGGGGGGRARAWDGISGASGGLGSSGIIDAARAATARAYDPLLSNIAGGGGGRRGGDDYHDRSGAARSDSHGDLKGRDGAYRSLPYSSVGSYGGGGGGGSGVHYRVGTRSGGGGGGGGSGSSGGGGYGGYGGGYSGSNGGGHSRSGGRPSIFLTEAQPQPYAYLVNQHQHQRSSGSVGGGSGGGGYGGSNGGNVDDMTDMQVIATPAFVAAAAAVAAPAALAPASAPAPVPAPVPVPAPATAEATETAAAAREGYLLPPPGSDSTVGAARLAERLRDYPLRPETPGPAFILRPYARVLVTLPGLGCRLRVTAPLTAPVHALITGLSAAVSDLFTRAHAAATAEVGGIGHEHGHGHGNAQSARSFPFVSLEGCVASVPRRALPDCRSRRGHAVRVTAAAKRRAARAAATGASSAWAVAAGAGAAAGDVDEGGELFPLSLVCGSYGSFSTPEGGGTGSDCPLLWLLPDLASVFVSADAPDPGAGMRPIELVFIPLPPLAERLGGPDHSTSLGSGPGPGLGVGFGAVTPSALATTPTHGRSSGARAAGSGDRGLRRLADSPAGAPPPRASPGAPAEAVGSADAADAAQLPLPGPLAPAAAAAIAAVAAAAAAATVVAPSAPEPRPPLAPAPSRLGSASSAAPGATCGAAWWDGETWELEGDFLQLQLRRPGRGEDRGALRWWEAPLVAPDEEENTDGAAAAVVATGAAAGAGAAAGPSASSQSSPTQDPQSQSQSQQQAGLGIFASQSLDFHYEYAADPSDVGFARPPSRHATAAPTGTDAAAGATARGAQGASTESSGEASSSAFVSVSAAAAAAAVASAAVRSRSLDARVAALAERALLTAAAADDGAAPDSLFAAPTATTATGGGGGGGCVSLVAAGVEDVRWPHLRFAWAATDEDGGVQKATVYSALLTESLVKPAPPVPVPVPATVPPVPATAPAPAQPAGPHSLYKRRPAQPALRPVAPALLQPVAAVAASAAAAASHLAPLSLPRRWAIKLTATAAPQFAAALRDAKRDLDRGITGTVW
jgi:hypothetical protein